MDEIPLKLYRPGMIRLLFMVISSASLNIASFCRHDSSFSKEVTDCAEAPFGIVIKRFGFWQLISQLKIIE